MERPRAGTRTTILILTALTALGSMSVSIYLPSLPNLADSLHASPSSVKLSLTVFLFVFAISQLIYGPLSDRFGRKPPILFGLGVYFIGSIACALAPTALMLVIARFIQGIGAAAGPALGRAVLRDLFSGDQLTGALATIAGAVALSPMLGPVIGGYLQVSFGWQSCFIFLSVASIFIGLGVFLSLPESNSQPPAEGLNLKTVVKNYTRLLVDQEYVASVVCGGLLTAGNFAWTAGAPFLFRQSFNFSPDQYGNVALFIGAGYVVGTFLSGRLSKRITAPVLVYGGMSISVVSGLLLLLVGRNFHSYPPLVALMSSFAVGMGVVMPMSAACALSRHPEVAGAAAGLLGSLQILAGTLGTLAIGLVRSPSVTPIAIILTTTALFSTLAAFIALRPFRARIISTRERLV